MIPRVYFRGEAGNGSQGFSVDRAGVFRDGLRAAKSCPDICPTWQSADFRDEAALASSYRRRGIDLTPAGHSRRCSYPTLGTPGVLRLDLALGLASGVVRVQANDPGFPPGIEKLTDGDTTTLSRSEDVNPLVLTFVLGAKIRLKTARIYLSYSSYDWKLGLGSGPPLVVREAAEEAWSEIELPVAAEVAKLRLEIRRLQRDNFVHVNEIEFYTAE